MSRLIRGICCASALAVLMAWLSVPLAGSTNWQLGDLFIGVGTGTFQVRDNTGATLNDPLTAGTGATGGCALDGSLNVYLVSTAQQQVIKRSLASPHSVLLTINTTSVLGVVDPQSVVVAANGNVIVGHKGGLIQVYSNAGGPPLTELQVDTVDTSDSFWLDLAADQNTLFYTSGGRTIRTTLLNGTGVSTTFKTLTGSLPNNKLGAIRLLAPLSGIGNDFTRGIRGVIVADNQDIKRLDVSGNVVATYDANSNGNLNSWVALGLDPKDVDELGADRAFWAGDFASGKVFRFNVATGAVEVGPVTTGVTNALSGICLNGEPTVGQFTGLINLDGTPPNPILSGTTSFATGTLIPDEEKHSFSISFAPPLTLPSNPVTFAVNAREVISNGVCTGGETNTTDVDCGFVHYFCAPDTTGNCTVDPQLPKGAAYAHRRSVFYRVVPSQSGLGEAVITIMSQRPFSEVLSAAGNCVFNSGPPSGLAIRVLRDPVDTAEDQFEFDVFESFFIDELGTRTKTNRFMAAFRCSQGFSDIQKPVDGRTFKAGNSISVQVLITDRFGNPVNTATTPPHHLVATVGRAGQVQFVLGTPGSSPNFFNSIGNGIYIANLQTTGLQASTTVPYNLCISDSIDSGEPQTVLPLLPQDCNTFFLR